MASPAAHLLPHICVPENEGATPFFKPNFWRYLVVPLRGCVGLERKFAGNPCCIPMPISSHCFPIYTVPVWKKHIVSPSTNPLIHLTALFRQGYVGCPARRGTVAGACADAKLQLPGPWRVLWGLGAGHFRPLGFESSFKYNYNTSQKGSKSRGTYGAAIEKLK